MMIYLTSTVICFNVIFQISTSEDVKVEIKTDKVIAEVDKSFHGVAFDASLFNPGGLWSFVNITSVFVINLNGLTSYLIIGLSPGYLRVGGTFANWLFFENVDNKWLTHWAFYNNTKARNAKNTTGWMFRPPNLLSKENFDKLVTLVKNSNMQLLFDLNAEIRLENGSWDQSEAKKIFDHCKDKGYNNITIDWELGNEPNHISANNLSAYQVGKDLVDLKNLLKTYDNLKGSFIVGPDVGWMGINYVKGLADQANEFLKAYTIHQYYFDGRIATKETYMNASYFYNLQKLFYRVEEKLKNYTHHKPLWLGETSAGYNSGTKDISDTYVSGFLWLDKLGLSAVNNVKVVIRQTLYNGFYGLLDKDSLEPNPDYWLTYIHNKLVGNKVFNVTVDDTTNQTRVYAHCTKIESDSNGNGYKSGSLTLFALNLNKHPVKLKLENANNLTNCYAYILKPGDGSNITSRKVNLNDKLLKMDGDNLPTLEEYKKNTLQNSIELESKTFGFFVFPDADVNECKQCLGIS